ncbi:LacI family DNA-binding transcriptional regulator [Streptomyces sp. SBT349]|uniref:LacI family DNA-binding transcriptional regulator n=1 Tax=Streptomyces sp. SBT349 TaxID=1580539 RepID=UPI00066C6B46|nr:LacI family DNA-binding transcriptional regulator [Streptomyces sp. SBT349]
MAADKMTITAIAREAGVSPATASRVVNGRGDVARGTRERVEELLRRHGHPPHGRASRDRSVLVEVVVNGINPWATEILRGVEQSARAAGLGTLVSALPEKAPDAERRWLADLRRRAPAGIVLAVWSLDRALWERLRGLGLPVVVVDLVGLPGVNAPTIGATNWAAGRTATEHLLRLGHRRIGFIAGPPLLRCSQARLGGYRTALETAGVAVDDALTVVGDHEPDSGFDACRRLMRLPRPPTAVFAANDPMAMGAREALRRRGLRVPEDVSVVGMDDLPATRLSAPALTTVRQPLARMGTVALRTLLRLSRGEALDAARLELATELVVRSSTTRNAPRV